MKKRISALFMAVSLSVVGSFAGVKTIPAAEEMSTTDISLYQEENQTQEKIDFRLIQASRHAPDLSCRQGQ